MLASGTCRRLRLGHITEWAADDIAGLWVHCSRHRAAALGRHSSMPARCRGGVAPGHISRAGLSIAAS